MFGRNKLKLGLHPTEAVPIQLKIMRTHLAAQAGQISTLILGQGQLAAQLEQLSAKLDQLGAKLDQPAQQ